MTMTSPESYIDDLKNKSYTELIKVRDRLIREIRYFEKHKEEIMNSEKMIICPSPDVHYWWNLNALGSLFKLLADKCLEEDNEDN